MHEFCAGSGFDWKTQTSVMFFYQDAMMIPQQIQRIKKGDGDSAEVVQEIQREPTQPSPSNPPPKYPSSLHHARPGSYLRHTSRKKPPAASPYAPSGSLARVRAGHVRQMDALRVGLPGEEGAEQALDLGRVADVGVVDEDVDS